MNDTTAGAGVIEQNWLERIGWLLAAAIFSGFSVWIWASFRKVDKAAHEKDLQRLEEAFDHRFSEFELRVVEPIRKRNSQFEQKIEAVQAELAKMNGLLIEIRTKLEVAGK